MRPKSYPYSGNRKSTCCELAGLKIDGKTICSAIGDISRAYQEKYSMK
ncbi:hypothetical protein ACVR0O_01575 [Streptococcus caviae]|nr:hypothetical protein [Streptococcus sp. 'caviae']